MKRIAVFFVLLSVFLSGCKHMHTDSDEPAMARVQDEYLYLSAITEKIPKGISARDSISMAKAIINQWIQKTMLVKQATENIPEEKLDFEEKLEQYRNSLIIYEYESSLIRQKIDTLITQQEIETYYEDHKQNFILGEGIVKANYIIIPKTFEERKKAREIFFQSENTSLIEEYCKQNNIQYYLEPTWIYFADLKASTPLRATSAKALTFSEKEIYDHDQIFLIKILGTRLTNDVKPIEFVEKSIKNILLNKRRTNFIKQMHRDIVEAGFEKNEIEIY